MPRLGGASIILASLSLWACGGSVPPTDRPVLLDSEDEVEPLDSLTCRVERAHDFTAPMEVDTPAIARDEDGSFLIAWIDRELRQRRVAVQQVSPSLDPVGSPTSFESDQGMPMDPTVALCRGRAWVAWQHLESRGGSTVRLSRWRGASSTELGNQIVGQGEHPAVACVAERGALTWTRRRGGLRDVLLRWADSSGSLGDPILLNTDSPAAHDPEIYCSGARCGVAWSDRRAIYPEIYASFIELSDDEATTPNRVTVHDQTDAGAGGGYAPVLTSTDGDSFLVAWYDTRSGRESEIYTATLNASGSVGAARRISHSPAPSTAPVISRCGAGQAVAWLDRRDGPPTVAFSALDHRGRRQSAVITIGRSEIESSSPAMVCGPGGSFALAWIEARRPMNALQLALVSCR